MDSEGLDKGSTATFIVKLGICNNPNDSFRDDQRAEVSISLDVNQSSDIVMG